MSPPPPGWPDVGHELGPRPTTIDYLFDDATEVQALLAEAVAFADEGFLAAARRSFDRMIRQFERHTRIEEHLVLPRLALTVAPERAVVREDHHRLRRFIAAAQRHLDRRDGAAFTRAARRLGDAHRRHERTEHRLYAPVRAEI